MKNKCTNTLPKSLKLSPRRKIVLTENDINRIQKLKNDLPYGWKSELRSNTSIDPRTIENALIEGVLEKGVVDRLRKYLDMLDVAAASDII